MPGVRGTIFVHHNVETRQINVHAVNHGQSPGQLTHNMRSSLAELKTLKPGVLQHDDTKFGHGNPVNRGSLERPQTATLSFPVGDIYQSEDVHTDGQRTAVPVPIQEGTWLRVGFRQRASFELPIPAPGEIVEIPYEAMRAQTSSSSQTTVWKDLYRYLGWAPEPMVRDGSHAPAELRAVMANKPPHLVTGLASIEAVAHAHAPTVLKGWYVRFDNGATGTASAEQTHGFTATAVLTDGNGRANKNAGLGLEAMPTTGGGSSARQFIMAGGDYGVRAEPGTSIRLGIRGHSFANTALPKLGERVELDLSHFQVGTSETQSAWFDGAKLRGKMGEKKNRVEFFENGRQINDELPDTVYSGTDAFERAEFKVPPRVTAQRRASDGAWVISMESLLPDADKLGPVGFSGKIWLEVDGQLQESDLAAFEFTPQLRSTTWSLQADRLVPGSGLTVSALVKARRARLVIDTGPLGWRGTLSLPRDGELADSTHAELQNWVLRETDYHRAALYPSQGSGQ